MVADGPAPAWGILRDLRGGDEEVFSELYRTHANAIFRFCFRATANWAVSEDLTAQVFLEAWRKRSKIVPTADGSVRPWLYGVANNMIRNQARSERRMALLLQKVPRDVVTPDFAEDSERRLDDERTMRGLLDGLAALPNADQELLRLAFWEQLTPAEIAIVLAISPGAARTRLARARHRLRCVLPLSEMEAARE